MKIRKPSLKYVSAWRLRFALREPVGAWKFLTQDRHAFQAWAEERYRKWYDDHGHQELVSALGVLQISDFDRYVVEYQENMKRAIEGGMIKALDYSLLVNSYASAYRWVLYALVRQTRPHAVIETGVGRGVSTSAILLGLQANGGGDLYSIELTKNEEKGVLVPKILRSNWHLIFGGAKNVLPDLLRKVQVDMFFHDSLHSKEHMLFEFSTVDPYLRNGRVIMADNVDCNDAFASYFCYPHYKAVVCRYNPDPNAKLGIALKATDN